MLFVDHSLAARNVTVSCIICQKRSTLASMYMDRDKAWAYYCRACATQEHGKDEVEATKSACKGTGNGEKCYRCKNL